MFTIISIRIKFLIHYGWMETRNTMDLVGGFLKFLIHYGWMETPLSQTGKNHLIYVSNPLWLDGDAR